MFEIALAQITAGPTSYPGFTQIPVANLMTQLTQIATIVGGIAALFAALGVWLVREQLRLATWANAQEIFTDYEFTNDRTLIQEHYERNTSTCPAGDRDKALLVCRKMDQLCCIVTEKILSENKLFQHWIRPIGKCWIVIESRWRMITDARNHDDNLTKWNAFMIVGEKASRKL
jgi:hypothetical protein